ncbi:MAG: tyrosine-type recombinase/integrase [Clostridia bacterium]|nr:tyrosine-type recombinase/integrase [Clostridia bacterium]
MKCSLLKKNGKYYVVVHYKDEFDLHKQKWIATGLSIKNNKTKANKILKEMEKKFVMPIENNNTIFTGKENNENQILFCDFLNDYLPLQKQLIEPITYHTYTRYAFVINKYFNKLNPTLVGLKPYHIENFYSYLQKKGLSGNSVIRYHTLIRKCLQYAFKNDFILSNPADKITKPKREKYKAQYYNQEELEKLFEVIKDSEFKVPIMIAGMYGFRRSEVIGLKWDAVDFENDTIEIKHKILETKVDNKRLVYKSNTLKTLSSNRILPLLPQVKQLLLKHKEKLLNNKKILGKGYFTEDEEYICVDNVGRLILPNRLTENFVTTIRNNKLKYIRFHDLRHSCASIMLANDVPMKQIQEWLGHSNFATTANVYAHLDYSSKIKSANTMEKVFSFLPKDEKNIEEIKELENEKEREEKNKLDNLSRKQILNQIRELEIMLENKSEDESEM